METRAETSKLAILKVLASETGAAGAARIRDRLLMMGIHLQPRTIRHYLLQLDREGLTHCVSRRSGRVITELGRNELSGSHIIERVGFVAARIDNLSYQMSFDSESNRGSVITNVAFINSAQLSRALESMRLVFARNLAVGNRLAVARPNETLGGMRVPEGRTALGTVCSVTVNGILLSKGIPVTSRFGGLLEIRDGAPVRFVHLVDYRGTTTDPLLIFIKAGMTRVRDCSRLGSGLIGASFREIPSAAAEEVRRLEREIRKCGLRGVLAIGSPSQPLLEIPVTEGHTGMIVTGGLNPIAALHETGSMPEIRPMAALEDFGRYQPIETIRQQYR
ncbi:MAG: DUF128 domain-containing protein [Verrucomicrobia bacterium]|nr:DUF128 domain-containing protein [Verrucomicrobiota bacterium]